MQLESEQTFGQAGLLVVVDQFGRLHPVDEVGKVKTLGGYTIGVPLTFFDGLANFLGITELLGGLLQFSFVVQSERGAKPAI